MSQLITEHQETLSALDKLKARIKAAASVGVNKIIMVPKDVSRFACTNPFHGKMKVSIDMHKRTIKEFDCECGLIYRKEN